MKNKTIMVLGFTILILSNTFLFMMNATALDGNETDLELNSEGDEEDFLTINTEVVLASDWKAQIQLTIETSYELNNLSIYFKSTADNGIWDNIEFERVWFDDRLSDEEINEDGFYNGIANIYTDDSKEYGILSLLKIYYLDDNNEMIEYDHFMEYTIDLIDEIPEINSKSIIYIHGWDLLENDHESDNWFEYEQDDDYTDYYDSRHLINLYRDGERTLNTPIEDLAEYLRDKIIHRALDYEAGDSNFMYHKIDIVSHSMGGLVARYLIKHYYKTSEDSELPLYDIENDSGEKLRIRHFFSMGCPNHGNLFEIGIGVQAEQMVEGSDFLDSLNNPDETEYSGDYHTWDDAIEYITIAGKRTGDDGDGIVSIVSTFLMGADAWLYERSYPDLHELLPTRNAIRHDIYDRIKESHPTAPQTTPQITITYNGFDDEVTGDSIITIVATGSEDNYIGYLRVRFGDYYKYYSGIDQRVFICTFKLSDGYDRPDLWYPYDYNNPRYPLTEYSGNIVSGLIGCVGITLDFNFIVVDDDTTAPIVTAEYFALADFVRFSSTDSDIDMSRDPNICSTMMNEPPWDLFYVDVPIDTNLVGEWQTISYTFWDNDNDRPNDAESTTTYLDVFLVDYDITEPIIEYEYFGDYTDGNAGTLEIYAYDDESELIIDPTGIYDVPNDLGYHHYTFLAINSYFLETEISINIWISDDDVYPPIIDYEYTGDYTDGNSGTMIFTASDYSGIEGENPIELGLNPNLINTPQENIVIFTDLDQDREGDQLFSERTETITLIDDDIINPTIDLEYFGSYTDGDSGYLSVECYDASGLENDPSGTYIIPSELDTYNYEFVATDNDNDINNALAGSGRIDQLSTIKYESITINDDDTEAPLINAEYTEFITNYEDLLSIDLTITDLSGISEVQIEYNEETYNAEWISDDLYNIDLPLEYDLGTQTFKVIATDNDNDRIEDSLSSELIYEFYIEDAIIFDMELKIDNLIITLENGYITASYDISLSPELNYRGDRTTDISLGTQTIEITDLSINTYTIEGYVSSEYLIQEELIENKIFLTQSFIISEELKQLVLDELYMLREMVESFDDSCWKDSHNRNNNPHLASNSKNAMLEKIDVLIEMVLDNLYIDAYDKLLHDIKPKLTGLKEDENGIIFGNGVFKNEWYICEEGQEHYIITQCNKILWSLTQL